MAVRHFDYEDNVGGVKLISPDGRSEWLQDDDAAAFFREVEDLEQLWEDNDWESPNPESFPTFEDHLDVLIDPYFLR